MLQLIFEKTLKEKKCAYIRLIEKYEIYMLFFDRGDIARRHFIKDVCASGGINFPLSRDRSIRTELKEKTDPYTSEYRISTVCNPHASSFILQNVAAGGPQRQANGEAAHNHNGYPAPASSSAHNVLNPMNNLNGINAQASYDAK